MHGTLLLRCRAKRMNPGGKSSGGGQLTVVAVVQGLSDLLALVRGGAHRACNSHCMVHLCRASGAARRPFQP